MIKKSSVTKALIFKSLVTFFLRLIIEGNVCERIEIKENVLLFTDFVYLDFLLQKASQRINAGNRILVADDTRTIVRFICNHFFVV